MVSYQASTNNHEGVVRNVVWGEVRKLKSCDWQMTEAVASFLALARAQAEAEWLNCGGSALPCQADSFRELYVTRYGVTQAPGVG